MPFRDRRDAGARLAAELAGYKAESPVVLALPRGGVPVAAEIATALDAPLDLILVRKIGVPFQPELAMGAVVDGEQPTVVRNEDVIALAGISEAAFQAVCDAELAEIERRRRAYVGERPPVAIAGHTVIVVDDGLATGATMKAALRALKVTCARPPGDGGAGGAGRYAQRHGGGSGRHRLPRNAGALWRHRRVLWRLPADIRQGGDRSSGGKRCRRAGAAGGLSAINLPRRQEVEASRKAAGTAGWARTNDLRIHNPPLYQLSYSCTSGQRPETRIIAGAVQEKRPPGGG